MNPLTALQQIWQWIIDSGFNPFVLPRLQVDAAFFYSHMSVYLPPILGTIVLSCMLLVILRIIIHLL